MRLLLPPFSAAFLFAGFLFVALLGPSDASARCAPAGLEVFLMNGLDHPVAADGALIAGLRSSQTRAREQHHGFPELTINRGRERIPLRLEVLSATMARYVPERVPPAGEYRVPGLGVRVRFSAQTIRAALPAPSLSAVQRRELPARRQVREQVRVVLAAAPPSTAIAVLAESDGRGFGGGAIPEGSREVGVYDWSGRCQILPQGLRPSPAVGSSVTIRFIDRDGQLGAPTHSLMADGAL